MLVFVYNVIVGYVVVVYTVGLYKALFLFLIVIDYVIIFYFMLLSRTSVTKERIPAVPGAGRRRNVSKD